MLFTWPRWRAILTTTYQLYLLLDCRWLQMPCAACFQLNVHPGKNSFHCKHTSLDCRYMFWRLLGRYQVFFFFLRWKIVLFGGGVRNPRLTSKGRPNKQGEKFRLWSHQTDSFACLHEKLSGIVWTPIRYMTLHFKRSVRCSFPPLQKSRRSHRCYVWTEAVPAMVFVPAQELCGIVYT